MENELQDRLHDRSHLLTKALYATQDGVMITDAVAPDDPIVFVNHAFERLTGYASEEVLGRNPRFLQAGDRHQPVLDKLRATRASSDDIEWTGVLLNYKSDGTPFWNELRAAAVHDEAGYVTHHIGIMSDVTERKKNEEKLREAETLFRGAFDGVAVGMALADPESGRYLRVNQAWCDMLGYSEEEMLQKTFQETTHPEDLEATMDNVRRMWRGETDSYQQEKRYVCADGRTVWALTSVSVVRDAENRPLYFAGQMQDTTERKRAEEELKESERRLVEAQRLARIGNWDWDVPTNTVTWSDEMYHLYGVAPDEFKGTYEAALEVVHPNDREVLAGAVAKAYEDFSRFRFDHRRVLDDGEVRVFTARGEVVTDESGEPVRMFGTVQDITEWRRVEEALRESEALYRGVVDTAPEAIVVTNSEGIIESFNPGAEHVFGYTPQEVVGRCSDTLLLPERLRASLEDGLQTYLQTDELQTSGSTVESVGLRKSGEEFPMELSIGQVNLQESSLFTCVIRDVSERKQAEEELTESYELLRSVMDGTTDAVFVKNLQGRYLMINGAGAEALGRSAEEIIGKDDTELFPTEDAREVIEEDQKALEMGETYTTENTKEAGREKRTFLTTKEPFRDGEGNVAGMFGVARDITDRKEAEEALRESEQRLQTIASNVPAITFALDSEGVFTFEDGAALKSLGLEPGWSIGRSVFEAYAAFPDVLKNVRRALSGKEVAATVEIAGITFHAIYTPQKNEAGEVEGVVGVATDITERRRLEEELEHRATHDPLTGLANRGLLYDRLSQALQNTGQQAGPVSLLYLDLDGFKEVNDRYGHETGDVLLEAVAGRIKRCLKSSDTAARTGGDEFIVLLEGVNAEKAGEVIRRIEAAIQTPFSIEERKIQISVSVGLAYAGTDEKDAAQLLREADREMYRAKREAGELGPLPESESGPAG